ncbi:MAG: DUF2207 domain-containing protein [Pseudomonadota bacterium]
MMRFYRIVWLLLIAIGILASAQGEEEIRQFEVEIEVEKDGDIVVTETIAVNVEGYDIRRGIFRELPATYADADGTGTLPYRYDVLSVRRDGEREQYERERNGNAVVIRIGDPDRYLDYRVHTYELRYRVKNQIRYFDDFDELFWNVTGSYWLFPIQEASARVTFPDGAQIKETNFYTGRLGAADQNADYRRDGDAHLITTTEPLGVREGLTISMTLEKGLIDPPSLSDQGWLWWARYGSLTALVASLLGLLGFYTNSFNRVGRDPAKGPVFPQYEPPKGYSPAAAHHIYHRGFSGHDGLIASLMYLAAQGQMRIDVDTKDKKKTTLSKGTSPDAGALPVELDRLYSGLFDGRSSIKLGEKYHAGFTKAYTSFRKKVADKYGSDYFMWNAGYVIVGGVLSVLAIIFAIVQHSYWSVWHTAGIVALIGLNGLFMYLMPAPTRRGQDVRTHLQGFRLYMEKAEKLQLNSVEVGSEAPPPMTVERYETFLPYAVALGVEKPWTKHFEKLIPDEAAGYNPTWTNMNAARIGSISGMTDRMVSGMSSGVSTAMPQSSGSSGSGGGGFSGGGGGGGGGGGW